MLTKKVMLAYIYDLYDVIDVLEKRLEKVEAIAAPKAEKKQAKVTDKPKRGRGRPKKTN